MDDSAATIYKITSSKSWKTFYYTSNEILEGSANIKHQPQICLVIDFAFQDRNRYND